MRLYRILNGLMRLAVSCILFTAGAYALFALWDNRQVGIAAESLQQEICQWKPQLPEESGEISFEELQAINPDVCGWLTMDGTGIDYPIVQGESNMTYLNRDFYGNFALAGSIFLDSRNRDSFEDCCSLLYGHHMAEGNMFGDLDLYKDGDFFDRNGSGQLLLPEGSCSLRVYAVLVVPASDRLIFDPLRWQAERETIACHIRQKALYLRPEVLADADRTLALTTCATEFPDARTVVLASMIEE